MIFYLTYLLFQFLKFKQNSLQSIMINNSAFVGRLNFYTEEIINGAQKLLTVKSFKTKTISNPKFDTCIILSYGKILL